MKKLGYYIVLLIWPALLHGQEEVYYTVKNQALYVTVNIQAPDSKLDSIFRTLNLGTGFTDSLEKGMVGPGTRCGAYRVYTIDPRFITLISPISEQAPTHNSVFDLFMVEELGTENRPGQNKKPGYSDREAGRSVFRDDREWMTGGGRVKILLPDHERAEKVYVAGSFNGWNYLENPMTQSSEGWVTGLTLKPGKHLYKFVVDGHWKLDPENRRSEKDFMGNENNVLFIPNHTFTLNGYENASRVYVAGSFNNWADKEYRMQRVRGAWRLPLFIPEGTHAYKFVVDDRWITDPANPIVREDGAGNLNSFLAIGDTFYFELKGFKEAKEVFVSGDFNAWQQKELRMERTSSGWRLPYVLSGGQYQYRFIVDNRWILDPDNPHRARNGKEVNSLLVVQPNHKFRYRHRPGVEEVRVAGTFNGWNEHGYTLKLQDGEWQISLHLDEGKHLYKFIVNDEWVVDKSNPLWEENEFGTGNSVLWIDEK